MKVVNNDPDFKVINWGEKQIDLTNQEDVKMVGHLLLTECHIKENGDINNKPSICLILRAGPMAFYSEISLKMFKPVLDELRKYEEH